MAVPVYHITFVSAELLFLCIVLSSAQTTYYVKPDNGTPCPTESDPCLTLSQYAQDFNQYISSEVDIVLEFLPGEHSLTTELIFVNVSGVTLAGDETVLEPQSIIICNPAAPAGLSFKIITNVRISYLAFLSCGKPGPAPQLPNAIIADTIGSFQLTNTILQGSLGTALFLVRTTATIEQSSYVNNSAETFGGALVISRSTVLFVGENLLENNSALVVGGGIFCYNSTLHLTGAVRFSGNVAKFLGGGGGAYFTSSIVMATGSVTFIANTVTVGAGGGINAVNSSLDLSSVTTFIGNSASQGGGVSVSNSTLIMTGTSIFASNLGQTSGGGLDASISNAILDGNITFIGNSASHGGGVSLSRSTLTIAGTSIFASNVGQIRGGGLATSISNVTLDGNIKFYNNSATAGTGGAVDAGSQTNITLSGVILFEENVAQVSGGINVFQSSLHISGNSSFVSNVAFFSGGAAIDVAIGSLVLSGAGLFQNNSAPYGSAIYLLGCPANIEGEYKFMNNTAAFLGGGMYISNSTTKLAGSFTFQNNSAQYGSAIYLFGSPANMEGQYKFMNNTAAFLGGGMYISNSTTKLAGSFTFQNNFASQGGGMFLEQNAVLYLEPPLKLLFESNSANQVGALFVEDVITLSDCSQNKSNNAQSASESDSECFVNHCFFQFNSSDLLGKEFLFVNNSATDAGTVLYGGKLENCTFTTESEYSGTALDVFMNMSNITNDEHNDTSIISSNPIRLCFLYNHKITCNFDYVLDVQIRRGAKFTIPAVAVGQANGTVSTVIRTYFNRQSGVNAELGENQHIQLTGKNFTDLEYRVFSMHDSEQLILYPEGPCRDIGIARRTIQIQLLPCPVGFNLSHPKCSSCEKRLQKFTTSCDVDTETIQRDSDFWMSGFYVNGSYRGVILHPRCPFDYCVTETIYIMLDDSSAQCAFNHAGTLCGSCQSNFSLVLGSSHCLHCSNAYLSLLLPFAVAGVALVMLILVLRLTVSVGTINGLIFYANILAVNQALFFPLEDTNILTVFIAWVNLDLGIETCFYDGMDAYARTWLQFVFPFYLWLLVAVIILASHFSQKLSRFLGTNPVSVLATIFLLSYAKLLRTIIAALSYTFLEYPDGSRVSVWLLDGNIRYFSAKHIPLFLTALAALLFLFLPYTLFLLLGQWMLALSNRKVFSWISKPTVKTFLDAYYGPYQDKHRYWTGLLLLLRGVLFLIFAFNAVGDPSINLLCITTASLGLTIMTRFTGQIYKNLWLDALEASFILNLGILAAATHHVSLAGGNQAALIYTSVSIAFATFIGIIVYHIYLQTQNSRLWKNFPRPNVLQIMRHMIDKYRRHNENEVQSPDPETKEEVTSSVVYMELREPLLEDS